MNNPIYDWDNLPDPDDLPDEHPSFPAEREVEEDIIDDERDVTDGLDVEDDVIDDERDVTDEIEQAMSEAGKGEGAVHVPNPRMQFRLPRENDHDYCYDERPTVLDSAMAILGPRLKMTKMGFLLDGKPVNTDKVLAAANLKYKDEQ